MNSDCHVPLMHIHSNWISWKHRSRFHFETVNYSDRNGSRRRVWSRDTCCSQMNTVARSFAHMQKKWIKYKLCNGVRAKIAGEGIQPKCFLFSHECAINLLLAFRTWTVMCVTTSKKRRPETFTMSANETVGGTKIHFGCHSLVCFIFLAECLFCIRLVASG